MLTLQDIYVPKLQVTWLSLKLSEIESEIFQFRALQERPDFENILDHTICRQSTNDSDV